EPECRTVRRQPERAAEHPVAVEELGDGTGDVAGRGVDLDQVGVAARVGDRRCGGGRAGDRRRGGGRLRGGGRNRRGGVGDGGGGGRLDRGGGLRHRGGGFG